MTAAKNNCAAQLGQAILARNSTETQRRREDGVKQKLYWLVVAGWVLWIRTQGPAVDDWSGLSGFSSEEQCQGNLKEKMDTWKQFKDATFAKNVVTFSGTVSTREASTHMSKHEQPA